MVQLMSVTGQNGVLCTEGSSRGSAIPIQRSKDALAACTCHCRCPVGMFTILEEDVQSSVRPFANYTYHQVSLLDSMSSYTIDEVSTFYGLCNYTIGKVSSLYRMRSYVIDIVYSLVHMCNCTFNVVSKFY